MKNSRTYLKWVLLGMFVLTMYFCAILIFSLKKVDSYYFSICCNVGLNLSQNYICLA